MLISGDGTTLSQIGHVDDGAVALRMLMMQPQTFGQRYNLTGRDYWSDEAYVDIFGELIGVTPHKVFVPAQIMDDIYAGKGDQSTVRKGVPTSAGRTISSSAWGRGKSLGPEKDRPAEAPDSRMRGGATPRSG